VDMIHNIISDYITLDNFVRFLQQIKNSTAKLSHSLKRVSHYVLKCS
jgi:hypothetical protein